jgi:hypothetical protein
VKPAPVGAPVAVSDGTGSRGGKSEGWDDQALQLQRQAGAKKGRTGIAVVLPALAAARR